MNINKRVTLFFILLVSNLQAQLPKAAVLEFNSISLTEAEKTTVEDKFAVEIFKGGFYDLIDRKDIARVMEELEFQESDMIEADDKVTKIGKLVGVSKVFLGSVEKAGKFFTIYIKMLDVESGRVENMASQEYKGRFSKFVKKQIKKVVDEVTNAKNAMNPISLEISFTGQRDGKSFKVKDGSTLMSGDKCHIMVVPNQRSYVYLINEDSKGNIYTLFPNPDQRYKVLSPGVEYHIPSVGKTFQLDDNVGEEKIYIMASLTPVKNIDEMLKKGQASKGDDKLAMVNAMTTRGFATITDGNDKTVALDNGINLKSKSSYLTGNKSFFHTITFKHIAKE